MAIDDVIAALDRIASNASDAAAALRLRKRLFQTDGNPKVVLLDDTNQRTAIRASAETLNDLNAQATNAIMAMKTDVRTIP